MKALIVYNPKSGLWSSLNVNLVEMVKKKLTSQYKEVEVFELKDWSGKIFKKYEKEKFDLIVAIGGDGTVKTCATLILDYMPDCALKIIPVGSANVLATSLKINSSALINVAKLGKIDKLKQIKIDVGQLDNQQYFLCALAMGYIAQVISQTGQGMKNRLGFIGYLLTFFRHRKSPIYDFTLEIDGKKYDISASTLAIVNTMNVFGLWSYKKIKLTDGRFNIFYMAYNSLWKLALHAPMFLMWPTKKMGHVTGQQVKLTAKNKHALKGAQLDGEEMVTKTRKHPSASLRAGENKKILNIQILPGVLKVLI